MGHLHARGRVEIFHNQSWGTVCDDYWDLADVVVVCRQLGCGFAELAHGSATFGSGTDNIWLDDVRCDGMEQNLGECTSQHLGKHNCHHREDAGAVCNRDQPPKPTLSLSRSADVLVRGEDILIYCGSLGFYNNAAFYLYREGQSSPIASRTPTSRGNSAAFLLTNVNEGQEGNYSCGYDVEESGRVFTSARSQSLTIVVKDQLKGPKIRDNARASILVRGQSLEITCEAPIFLSGCRFHLHKRGDDSFKASMVATARSNSVTFQISDITSREEGNYSCDYQAEIAGKFFNSTPSLDLKVEVIGEI
ncbi:deleted in malignant brain tumors 1 protein-like [Leucoraja erinacea]|uniref:deleted in malignant brain tumors 1 protein-like n=1 Tax=Leucoraja erinaceus TaxID=7782 RepID=UPI002456BE71|nr:deleted in malignant brain tumors 1 protein-like [Leucoraja erinacea]